MIASEIEYFNSSLTPLIAPKNGANMMMPLFKQPARMRQVPVETGFIHSGLVSIQACDIWTS